MEHEEKKYHHESGGHEEEHYEKRTPGRGEEIRVLDGLHISKRALWTLAGGALGALALPALGKVFERARPVVVGAVKEGYGFKEWLAGKFERAKEDVQDVMAEAVYSYHQDLNVTADAVKREKELLEKIEKLIEERMAKTSEKKEG